MSHQLNSIMLYIHPTLSIIGYVFLAASLITLLREVKTETEIKSTRTILYGCWAFNLAGLVTGMIWAQLAWGAYWSWDPKETATLILFTFVCLSVLLYEEDRKKLAFYSLVGATAAVIVNVWITLGGFGLHSY